MMMRPGIIIPAKQRLITSYTTVGDTTVTAPAWANFGEVEVINAGGCGDFVTTLSGNGGGYGTSGVFAVTPGVTQVLLHVPDATLADYISHVSPEDAYAKIAGTDIVRVSGAWNTPGAPTVGTGYSGGLGYPASSGTMSGGGGAGNSAGPGGNGNWAFSNPSAGAAGPGTAAAGAGGGGLGDLSGHNYGGGGGVIYVSGFFLYPGAQGWGRITWTS